MSARRCHGCVRCNAIRGSSRPAIQRMSPFCRTRDPETLAPAGRPGGGGAARDRVTMQGGGGRDGLTGAGHRLPPVTLNHQVAGATGDVSDNGGVELPQSMRTPGLSTGIRLPACREIRLHDWSLLPAHRDSSPGQRWPRAIPDYPGDISRLPWQRPASLTARAKTYSSFLHETRRGQLTLWMLESG